MNNHIKYSRTYHLPFSKGLINDDRMVEDIACFNGKTVEVSIKMDGENTSVYPDGLHARSLSSSHHPSRSWIKGFHATIKNEIPEGWRFVFESMYAKHSIFYDNLESLAYLINIWNENNECLPLADTLGWTARLNLIKVPTVKILKINNSDLSAVEDLYLEVIASGHEGIVIRNIESFHYNDFATNVAKAVRPNHVTTDQHWSQNWIPNQLKKP
jgi:hypothetical protein